MSRVALGAVGYLNARPLVYGLEQHPRFSVRYDVPSRCAELLHAGHIDLGLIPSIEYLRGPSTALGTSPNTYAIVPGLAIASTGPVASVALYTRREIEDVRSIAMDTSSRTSVALARVLAERVWHRRPSTVDAPPELEAMLQSADAAVIIGDNALLLDHESVGVRKFDLGELWTSSTGLPFVYAFWAGRSSALAPPDIHALVRARDEGVAHTREIARSYFQNDPGRQSIGERYLRDNIRYVLGPAEMDGLSAFYHDAAALGLVPDAGELRFYPDGD